MAKKNKTPLKEIVQRDLLENIDIDKAMDLTTEELETLGLDKDKLFDVQQKATFATDQALGVGAGALTGKKVDNSVIDAYIKQIETPTGTDVYSKQAAMYRARGEGDFLRTQKNLANLFLPTLDLIKKREAAAMARFTLLKNRMPEFDDTTIFGDQTGNPMPIADEIKNISSTTKEDLRQLSRLNPMDERYDEIKKRVEKNQKLLVSFDNVNQKLLEIRNAGTDESQWSRGMDETTANMWRDIYTSNGKNIKIVGDKLVWTDTKGTTKTTYNIPDDNTGAGADVYDDETYSVLVNSKGDDPNSEQYKRGEALRQLHWFSEQLEYQDKKLNDPNHAKKVQNALNTLGITDDDGNALEVDGKFGPKSKQAYNKYLAQKGNLNKQHLDQYMTEEDAAKYRTTTTTGVGETRVIDLEQIGDGPTMIDNNAVNQDIIIRGNVQQLIDAGVGVDDPMYNTLIKQKVFELNNVGPEGIKSLIFDGLRNDPDSIYNGINTDEFVEQVIRNHYGDDLTESEIAEKIELMRAGDVTQMYNNGKGGQDTLQTQFMEWYKKTIDKKIEDGIMSTRVGQPQQTDPNQTTPGQTTPGQTTPGQSDPTGSETFSLYTENFAPSNSGSNNYIGTNATLPDIPLQDGTIHRNTKIEFVNGVAILTSDLSEIGRYDKKNQNKLIGLLQNLYPNATDEQLKDFVEGNIKKSKKIYEDDLKSGVANVIKLYRKGQTIGGRKVDDYLLSYGDDDFVINSLNREYGKDGFTFYYAGAGSPYPQPGGMSDNDTLAFSHKNYPVTFYLRFDTATEEKDLKNTQHLMKIMNALKNKNLDAAYQYAQKNGVINTARVVDPNARGMNKYAKPGTYVETYTIR